MTSVTPFLWFDNNAEEALDLYTSVFPDATVSSVSRYPEGGPAPAGTLFGATLDIGGQQFQILNGGRTADFAESFSLFVPVDTQDEIDRLWEALTADGGEPGRCGWLKDRFGLSWQVIPSQLGEWMSDPDPEKGGRTIQALMQMDKLDIAELQKAHDGT